MEHRRCRLRWLWTAIAIAWLPVAASAGIAVPDGALARGGFDGDEPRVEARLLLHPDDDPAEGSLRVGVLFDLDPGWHIYARDPGDTGLPTRVQWQIDGADAAPLAWPEHRTFVEAEGTLLTRGYEDRVLLTSVLHFDPGSEPGGSLRAEVDALVCADQCIPVDLGLVRRLADADPAPPHQLRPLFAEAAASVLRAARPDAAGGAPLGLLSLLGFALLGGVILNAMPCVLPVLAIKLLAVAQLAHHDRRDVLRHGAAYTGGVLASMAVLAGAVVALRRIGFSLGWGFQFQEPVFLGVISAVVLLFALNLLGVFEIGFQPGRLASLGANAVGARRSFFEGLLVVALATPCSAPFLGTAVGFALAGSPLRIFGVFGCIGVGLAAPFVVVSLVPGWARLLPRPGPWMLHLRAALGFVLLATLVWLLWVLGRITGLETLVTALAGLWLLGAVAWIYGRLQASGRAACGRWGVLAAAAFLLVATNTVSVGDDPGDTSAPGLAGEATYTRDAVSAARAAGRPVFVYFTADWCLTCKANERLVLGDAQVRAAFVEHDVAAFRADWTRRDETIRKELARFGRAGVPLYLVHASSDDATPLVLPELLTADLLVGAIAEAGALSGSP